MNKICVDKKMLGRVVYFSKTQIYASITAVLIKQNSLVVYNQCWSVEDLEKEAILIAKSKK